VTERASGLHHYEVSFYVKYVNRPLEGQEEQLAYVVFYDCAPSIAKAFVYLPGRADEWYRLNTRAILHDREGHWFRPTSAWQQAVDPLIARATSTAAVSR
jgi:hypothetical protein